MCVCSFVCLVSRAGSDACVRVRARGNRALLAESYKDAIDAVEALETINKTTMELGVLSVEVNEALARMGDVSTRKRTMRGSDEAEAGGAGAERAMSTTLALGSRVKFLLDTPEKIWGLLEDCDYASGAQRLTAAIEVLGALTTSHQGSGAADDATRMFPVLRQQSTVLSSFKAHVSKRARAGLERTNLRTDEAASALSALFAVESLSTSQAMKLLLQMRRAWVRACLRDIASSVTTQDMLNKRLAGLMRDVKHIIQLTFDMFAGDESILMSESKHKIESLDDLFHGVFEPEAEIERFQRVMKDKRGNQEILSATTVSDACRAWLDAIAGDIKQRGVAVFGKMSNCKELAALERSSRISSENKEWNDMCIKVFKENLNLWDILFEQPWLHQGFALFKTSLAFSHIKPQVDAALDAAVKKSSSDARRDSSVWSSSSSKDANLNIPEDIKSAYAVANSLNQAFLSVRKDALMLQGVQAGGHAELEGRFAALAEHIQTCAHKGLVELAQYLSMQVQVKSSDTSRALMCGHLAKAVTSGVKEINVLLNPANMWPKYNDGANLIIKPPKTLRGVHKTNEPENVKIKSVTDGLQQAMNAGFKVWVDECASAVARRFKDALASDDALMVDETPAHWEEVSTDKVGDGLSLRLPATISSYVLTALHNALQETQRIGGHLLPRTAIHALASSLAEAMLHAYDESLALSQLSEKGTLQVLLDVKFTSDVLARSAAERTDELQKQLTRKLDPIDWATYEPHLWENERRAYRRCSVLLGGFIQLSNLYQDTLVKPASGANPKPITAKAIARFSYLPVSLPTLRGGANADRAKGKIDWGEIMPDATDDEEREGLLSSFMQSSRIGLGNILREFA